MKSTGQNKLKKFRQYLNNHALFLAMLVALSLIAFTLVFGWYNNKVVTSSANVIASYSAKPNNPLSFMARWDGPDYIHIAQHGYTDVSLASFFPLYPILIHYFSPILRSPLNAALFISWVCLVGAVYFYIKILKELFKIRDNTSTIKGLIFFILFPSSVFLVATYTESLFALLALGSIYFALKKNYIIPAILMFFGCLTHLDSIFVLVLVALILLEQKVERKKVLLTFIVGLLGFDAYAIYLQKMFGNPLAFILSQKGHGWLTHHYFELYQSIDFFNLVFLALLVISVIYYWNRRRSFSIYSILFILVPIIGNQFGGFNRYMLIAFPVQFMAYDYLKDKHMAYSITLAIMGIAWAYFTLQYAGGYIGG